MARPDIARIRGNLAIHHLPEKFVVWINELCDYVEELEGEIAGLDNRHKVSCKGIAAFTFFDKIIINKDMPENSLMIIGKHNAVLWRDGKTAELDL